VERLLDRLPNAERRLILFPSTQGGSYSEAMRPIERDLRLLILAASSGSADGWSYLGLGHAFVANMTGSTVLLGVAVFQNHGDMLHPAICLGSYAVGAMIGSLLTADVRPGASWPKRISWTLMLEGLLLLAAEVGWIATQIHSSHAPNLNLLLATAALAIGLQSSAMVQLNIPGVVTTYITGTWTTLLGSAVRLARQERRQARSETVETEERLLLQAAVLCVYFLSAVLTGWLFQRMPAAVGTLPALAVLVTAVRGVIHDD
jgi:uncharacterized membrane protein YoaK (UPF0700 family)